MIIQSLNETNIEIEQQRTVLPYTHKDLQFTFTKIHYLQILTRLVVLKKEIEWAFVDDVDWIEKALQYIFYANVSKTSFFLSIIFQSAKIMINYIFLLLFQYRKVLLAMFFSDKQIILGPNILAMTWLSILLRVTEMSCVSFCHLLYDFLCLYISTIEHITQYQLKVYLFQRLSRMCSMEVISVSRNKIKKVKDKVELEMSRGRRK